MNKKANQILKNIPNLSSNEVHIWLANFLENDEYLDDFTSVLSEDEKQKATNFKFLKDRKQWVISRGILRNLLGMYLGLKPMDIEILYGLWGKPQLLDKFSLYFNVSHSRDYVIYALSPRSEVGVDLEYIDLSLDTSVLLPNILSSPQELAYWQGVKEGEKIRAFFNLWVCKEAFLKTYGKGWLNKDHSVPARVIDYLKGEKNKNSSKNKLNPYMFEPIPGYIAALFVKKSDKSIPLHYIWDSRMVN